MAARPLLAQGMVLQCLAVLQPGIPPVGYPPRKLILIPITDPPPEVGKQLAVSACFVRRTSFLQWNSECHLTWAKVPGADDVLEA